MLYDRTLSLLRYQKETRSSGRVVHSGAHVTPPIESTIELELGSFGYTSLFFAGKGEEGTHPPETTD
jgi:hypothetical protein